MTPKMQPRMIAMTFQWVLKKSAGLFVVGDAGLGLGLGLRSGVVVEGAGAAVGTGVGAGAGVGHALRLHGLAVGEGQEDPVFPGIHIARGVCVPSPQPTLQDPGHFTDIGTRLLTPASVDPGLTVFEGGAKTYAEPAVLIASDVYTLALDASSRSRLHPTSL